MIKIQIAVNRISCNALCYFVRVNFMIHADCYRCRIHVMYFGFFFSVHSHQEVHKRKDKYSRFVCCLHEIFIIREIWNFVTHQFFYHFMIIFHNSHFKMKSVDVQCDNLLKAQFSFGSPIALKCLQEELSKREIVSMIYAIF